MNNTAQARVRYVLGFAFDADRQHVALIRKARPSWQAGKLNGIGGSMMDGEAPVLAMAREFEEETGVALHAPHWQEYAVLVGVAFHVHTYRAFNDRVHDVRSATDERVLLINVVDAPSHNVLSNLRWLIPMALDKGEHDRIALATVTHTPL